MCQCRSTCYESGRTVTTIRHIGSTKCSEVLGNGESAKIRVSRVAREIVRRYRRKHVIVQIKIKGSPSSCRESRISLRDHIGLVDLPTYLPDSGLFRLGIKTSHLVG